MAGCLVAVPLHQLDTVQPRLPLGAVGAKPAGHHGVRRVIVAVALLSSLALVFARGTPAGAITPKELSNATLPAGVCSSGVSGVPQSGPIPLSNGVGTVGTTYDPDFFGAHVFGTPVHVNLAGAHHAGLAASIVCNQGGSVAWDEMWVFDGSAKAPKILFGGITPRSYDDSVDGNVGTLISRIRVKGQSLVVREEFPAAGDCVTCSTGRTTTAWSWSPSNPGHLVITQPAPKKVVVVTGATPSGLGGSRATRNQAGSRVVAGRTVLATCTGQDISEGTPWTELDTGAWLPSGDLQSVNLPNCDGTTPVASSSSSSTSTSTTIPTSSSLPTATTGGGVAPPPSSCPTAAQVLATWQASPGSGNPVAAGTVIAEFANVQCWENWVIAFPVDSTNGNGFIVFSQSGGLHGVSTAEGSQFASAVCSDPSSPPGWRGEVGC